MRRRTFLIAAAVLLFVSSAPAQQSTGEYLVFVGSYTHPTLTTTSASRGIYAFRFDSKSGTLAPLGIAAEAVNPAHLWASPNGKYLYISNRGHDSLALYSVDPGKGTLTLVEHIPSLGRTPRNITIDPSNEYLFCANQNGENVVVFGIDHRTGHLTPTGSQQSVPQAAGIAIVKVQ